jgi:hypothetical protein
MLILKGFGYPFLAIDIIQNREKLKFWSKNRKKSCLETDFPIGVKILKSWINHYYNYLSNNLWTANQAIINAAKAIENGWYWDPNFGWRKAK